jgi:hypothetical protein
VEITKNTKTPPLCCPQVNKPCNTHKRRAEKPKMSFRDNTLNMSHSGDRNYNTNQCRHTKRFFQLHKYNQYTPNTSLVAVSLWCPRILALSLATTYVVFATDLSNSQQTNFTNMISKLVQQQQHSTHEPNVQPSLSIT